MTPLGELALVIRSKNAGPFLLTFDVLFRDAEVLEQVRQTGDLSVQTVARAFEISPNAIRDFAYYPFASAVKFSIRRAEPSGSRRDTDVYGAQQYAPLLHLPIHLDGATASAETR